ncbi:protein MAIN-LIKE 1-like [Phaseolus vulgaris]|uniref:protein MAIN-LIKE 1-like n=1 Tax=Phaseolus vulgaris TaxID=3885 RepID=UPI0035CBEEBF
MCMKTHAQGGSGLWLSELTYFTLSVALFLRTRVLHQSVFYLGFFVDLRLTVGYSWASTALTHMYEQLGDCSYANTKKLDGYATLLQGWIYEHFPSIGMRRMQALYSEDQPRCRLYDAGKGTSIVVVRPQLDTLTPTSIRFCPYNEHREEPPFEWISLFYGYLRLGNWTQLHMSERVLRQYEYTQIIPCNPSVLGHGHPDTNEMDRRWLHFNDYVIHDYAIAPYPDTCVEEYMSWFRSVSHHM